MNGGAGRMISSLPAFQKYYKLHGPDFYIVAEAGMEFFVGHKELQDLAFPLEHKGLFESIIKPNECVSLEPYREHGYYNQKRTLAEAFDKLVNNTDDHSDLEKPKIVLSKQEEIQALDCINNVKEYHKKKKTAAINLTDHNSPPVAIKQYFVPYQKRRPAGVPNNNVASIGLSFQYSQTS